MTQEDWIILALVHLSVQVSRLEAKVNLLLQNSHPDFSKEDKVVLDMTQTIEEALGKIPHAVNQ